MISDQMYLFFFQAATTLYVCSLVALLFKRDQWARYGLILGFTAHSVSQVMRCWRFGFFTLEGAFLINYFLPWALAAMLLFAMTRQQREKHSRTLSALWILAFSSLISCLNPPTCHVPTPFTPTWTAYLFFIFEGLSYACFILSGWRAIEYLLGRRRDTAFNGYAIWGFVFFSLAQLTGCAWAYLGWGGLFHWGTRHIHSAALWCCYCAYLHTVFINSYNPRKRASYAFGASLLALLLFFALPLIPNNVSQIQVSEIEKANHKAQSIQQMHKRKGAL